VQRISSVQTAVTATATYCQLQSELPASFAVGKVLAHYSILAAATINVVAAAGTTAGTVQPLVMGSDGVFRAYGAPINSTAAGAVAFIQITSPVCGVALQVTATVVGGSLYIETTAVIL